MIVESHQKSLPSTTNQLVLSAEILPAQPQDGPIEVNEKLARVRVKISAEPQSATALSNRVVEIRSVPGLYFSTEASWPVVGSSTAPL